MTLRDYAAAALAGETAGGTEQALRLLNSAIRTIPEPTVREFMERLLALELERSVVGHEPASAAVNMFRQEGEYWTLVYGGKLVRLRNGKGLRDVVYLLTCRGERVPAATLGTRERVRRGEGSPRTSEAPVGFERERKAATARIRDVIAKIERLHPSLGRHLRLSIRTGVFCSYHPDEPPAWHVQLDPDR